jgi:hypothetical protein
MEREDFVEEGQMEVGPAGRYFVFLDGKYLGQQPLRHFRLPEESGYPSLGWYATA